MSILSDEFYYQPIRIDTINTRVFADLIAKEGDANGRGLLVTLTENGLMKDTTGIALNLKWEHTSVGNQGLDNFDAVDLSKGLYKITYPTEMLNRGKVRAFIQIVDSGKLAGVRNIEITVDRGVGDDTAIASSDSFTALAQALIDVNNLESTYAPELLSVKQQLAENESKRFNFAENAKRFNKNRFLAHRGVMTLYPENTLIAFEKGCQRGYFGIETDINETSDGEWIIMHDDSVDRTTTGTGNVWNLSLAQMQAMTIDAGSNIALYPNLKIPTLREYLKIIKRYNSTACIEMKNVSPNGYDTLLDLLEQFGLIDSTIILSFSRTHLEAIRSRNKKIGIMLNANIAAESIAWCAAQGNAYISTPYQLVTTALVKEAHDNGVFVVSYSINNPFDARVQMDMGVDLMTTDGKVF